MKKLLFILALLCAPLARGQAIYPTSYSNGGNITASNAGCVPAACVGITLPGQAAVITVGVTGTFSATLKVEESQDGGTTFTSAGSDLTSTGTTSYVIAGFTQFRVRASAVVSGNAGVNLQVSSASSGSVTSGTADPTGNSCAANALYVQTTTGKLYSCKAGVFALASGSTIALQTNGVANGSQTTLNLANGGGVTVTDNGTGTDTIAAAGCTSNCTYVLTTADQQWVQSSAGSVLGTANQAQFVKFYNNATRGLGNACFRVTTLSAGGHGSIGVYSLTGTLLWSTGSFSTASATSLCVTPTPVTLAAGTNYYLAWCMDNTTAILAMAANSNLWQFTTNTGAPAHTFGTNATDTCTAGVLPSTITPANIANTTVQLPYVQVFL